MSDGFVQTHYAPVNRVDNIEEDWEFAIREEYDDHSMLWELGDRLFQIPVEPLPDPSSQNITADAFARVADHLDDSLRACDVSDENRTELLTRVAEFKSEIVTALRS